MSPDGKEARGIMPQEKRLSFFNHATVCLTLSHGHRKANPTGPPQVVISPGFFDKSQRRAQSSLQGNCWLVLPRRYLQEVEVESFALVGTWQTYASCTPLSPPDPSQICIFAAGSGKSVLWLVASLLLL